MDPQALDKVRCSLAVEALRLRGVLKLRAAGVSMLPTLWPGDLLTVQCLRAEEAEPGEIVLYRRSDRFFVHRIVSKNLSQDNASLITRGDCMPADDPRSEAANCWAKLRQSSARNRYFRRRAGFRSRAGFWRICSVTGACSGAPDSGSGITATVAMARLKAHSSEQHSNRIEARAIPIPCHGAARE